MERKYNYSKDASITIKHGETLLKNPRKKKSFSESQIEQDFEYTKQTKMSKYKSRNTKLNSGIDWHKDFDKGTK